MRKTGRILMTVVATIAAALLLCGCAGGVPASKLDMVKDAGVLVVGTTPDYAPYEFIVANESGEMEYVGIDMEIAEEIAADLGVALRIEPMEFTMLEGALEAGEIDMILAAYSATEGRAETMAFSTPYYTDEVCVFAAGDAAGDYTDVSDFAGKRVGVQIGTTLESVYLPQLSGAEAVSLKTTKELVEQLRAGEIDAIIVEKPIAEAYIAADDGLALTSVVFPDAETTSFVACLPTDAPEFLSAVNATIEKLVASGAITQFAEDAQALQDRDVSGQ